MINKKTFFTFLVITVVLFASSFLYLNSRINDNYFTSSNSQSLSLASLKQAKNFNDEITNSRKNIITETVQKVSPAIVGINVIEIRQYRDPFSSMFDLSLIHISEPTRPY